MRMNKLDSALRKFNAALARLEQVAAETANRPATGPSLSQQFAADLKALREDRTKLAEELARLNVEKVALEGFTDEVAGRLEGAIREIRAVLAH